MLGVFWEGECLVKGTEVKGVFHEACAAVVIAFLMEAVSPNYVRWMGLLWWTLSL